MSLSSGVDCRHFANWLVELHPPATSCLWAPLLNCKVISLNRRRKKKAGKRANRQKSTPGPLQPALFDVLLQGSKRRRKLAKQGGRLEREGECVPSEREAKFSYTHKEWALFCRPRRIERRIYFSGQLDFQ